MHTTKDVYVLFSSLTELLKVFLKRSFGGPQEGLFVNLVLFRKHPLQNNHQAHADVPTAGANFPQRRVRHASKLLPRQVVFGLVPLLFNQDAITVTLKVETSDENTTYIKSSRTLSVSPSVNWLLGDLNQFYSARAICVHGCFVAWKPFNSYSHRYAAPPRQTTEHWSMGMRIYQSHNKENY